MRSSGIEAKQFGIAKEEGQLDTHAKILYEWLDTSRVSRVRMLMAWQSAAGLSYVASVHHRAVQCFRYQGNKEHAEGTAEVTLAEFQEGIKERHRLGSRGMEEGRKEQSCVDFT